MNVCAYLQYEIDRVTGSPGSPSHQGPRTGFLESSRGEDGRCLANHARLGFVATARLARREHRGCFAPSFTAVTTCISAGSSPSSCSSPSALRSPKRGCLMCTMAMRRTRNFSGMTRSLRTPTPLQRRLTGIRTSRRARDMPSTAVIARTRTSVGSKFPWCCGQLSSTSRRHRVDGSIRP